MSENVVCIIILIPVALYGATVYGFTMFFSLPDASSTPPMGVVVGSPATPVVVAGSPVGAAGVRPPVASVVSSNV